MLAFWKGVLFFVGVTILAASAANAKVYSFRVNCSEESFVALWDSGFPDPGIYHFRIATGDVNLDCSVYDYFAKTDRDLPRRWCSDPGAAIQFFPQILILSGASHCRW